MQAMEEDLESVPPRQDFWHYLRYNPTSLLSYWVAHIKQPHAGFEFWQMLNWNAPSGDALFAPWEEQSDLD